MATLVRLPDRAALDHACACWLARQLQPAGRPLVFATCGGRSVGGVLARLAERADVPWHAVHLFLADERVVPPGHVESNLRPVREALLDPLQARALLPASNIHPFRFPAVPSGAEEAAAVDACNRELQALGGRFDAVLLSAGEDGHVAALFPGHRSIDDPAEGFFRFDDSPKPPAARVSASRALLLRSRSAALLFAGEAKRLALAAFMADGSGAGAATRGNPAALVRALPVWAAFTDLDPR